MNASRLDSLYVSHTGMTEALGQSQVLGYLRGLARRGFSIDVIAFEPQGTPAARILEIGDRMRADGIGYHPQVRSSSHALGVKVWESALASGRGLIRALRRRPHIIHARSHLPAAVADVIATLVPEARLLFDCRGMMGDEYVDAGHWTEARLEYKLLKGVERRLFRRSEGLVVLTNALHRWLVGRGVLGKRTTVEVIPCCVDTDAFRPDPTARARTRMALGLSEDDVVVVYSGSLGSWYMAKEMGRFVGGWRPLGRMPKLLLLTRSDPAELRASALSAGLPDSHILTQSALPEAMPSLLAACDVGISFIRSCFSKMGSSPTKVAEYLASGLAVCTNGDIGDLEELRVERDAVVVNNAFDDGAVRAAQTELERILARPLSVRQAAARGVAERRFSLEGIGVMRYERLYRSLGA